MPVMQEKAQETRDIIHRHIMPEEEEFGSPFDLWESRQSSLTVGSFAVLGRLAGRYGAGR